MLSNFVCTVSVPVGSSLQVNAVDQNPVTIPDTVAAPSSSININGSIYTTGAEEEKIILMTTRPSELNRYDHNITVYVYQS